MPPRKRASAPPDDLDLDDPAAEPPEEDERAAEDDIGDNEPDPSEDDEGEFQPEDDEEDEGDGEAAETVIRFEDDGADEDDGGNTVIRRIRDRNKELAKEVAELRQQAAAHVMPELDLGPKPTLADADYDEDQFEQMLDNWKDKKREIDSHATERAAPVQAEEVDWQRDLANYAQRRDALGVPDFDVAAEVVKSALRIEQQAVIVKAARDAPALVYALSHSDGRLAELAKISDPIKLAAAIARMEGGLKVVKRRKAPAPDRAARGSSRLPGSADKQLAKLEADAVETGDRTAVIAHKKRMKERSKK